MLCGAAYRLCRAIDGGQYEGAFHFRGCVEIEDSNACFTGLMDTFMLQEMECRNDELTEEVGGDARADGRAGSATVRARQGGGTGRHAMSLDPGVAVRFSLLWFSVRSHRHCAPDGLRGHRGCPSPAWRPCAAGTRRQSPTGERHWAEGGDKPGRGGGEKGTVSAHLLDEGAGGASDAGSRAISIRGRTGSPNEEIARACEGAHACERARAQAGWRCRLDRSGAGL